MISRETDCTCSCSCGHFVEPHKVNCGEVEAFDLGGFIFNDKVDGLHIPFVSVSFGLDGAMNKPAAGYVGPSNCR